MEMTHSSSHVDGQRARDTAKSAREGQASVAAARTRKENASEPVRRPGTTEPSSRKKKSWPNAPRVERSVTHAKGPRSAYRTIARAFMAAARTRAGKTNLPSLLRLKRPLLMCFLRGRTASTVDEKASLLLLGLRLRVDVSDSSRGLSGIFDARCSSGQRSDARVGPARAREGSGRAGRQTSAGCT